ncbi:MAG: hypothetical protein JKY50_22505 [Oleispira sp.]|nr:hypothetical protein [Oleispira sp.]
MPLNYVSNPYPYYNARNKGQPIFNGEIFVGKPNLDPTVVANQLPLTAKQQDGVKVPISQPVSTNSGGYAVDVNGNMVVLLVDGNYSIRVNDSSGQLAFEQSDVQDGVPLTDADLDVNGGVILTENGTLSVFNYNTLADASSSLTLVNGQAISLSERTTGNGGGAIWDVVIASTVTINTFDVVQSTGVPSLAMVLRITDGINMKQYGATGDGSTDDSPAIQAAFDSGRSVFFPYGTYKSNTELIVKHRNTSMEMELGGPGDGVTQIISEAATGFALRLPSSTSPDFEGDIDGLYWSNVRINMSGVGSGCVDFGAVSFSTVINSTFTTNGKEGQTAMRLRGDDLGSGAYYNTFIGCSMGCGGTAFKSPGSFGVELYETTIGATPNSNTFMSCRMTGSDVGIRISGNNNSFYSPYLESNSGTAIQFTATANNRCLDNIVMNARVEGSLTNAVISFGVFARTSKVYAGHLSSFSPGVMIIDSSDGSNSWDLNDQIVSANLVKSWKMGDIAQLTETKLEYKADKISYDQDRMWLLTGSGSPDGSVDAPQGSLWTNQAASSGNTLLYMKTSPLGTLTGWVANTQ